MIISLSESHFVRSQWNDECNKFAGKQFKRTCQITKVTSSTNISTQCSSSTSSEIQHTHFELWYKSRHFLLPIMQSRCWCNNEKWTPYALRLLTRTINSKILTRHSDNHIKLHNATKNRNFAKVHSNKYDSKNFANSGPITHNRLKL